MPYCLNSRYASGSMLLDGYMGTTSDIHPFTTLEAYRQGIVLWPSEDEKSVHWCYPQTRAVFKPGQLHISRRLRRSLRTSGCTTTLDMRFDEVAWYCANGPNRRGGTWLTREYRQVLGSLHLSGWAHSIEVWKDDSLVGGLIGLGIGNVFVADSMVSIQPSMSTAALVHLDKLAHLFDYTLIDCQQMSPHLKSLGAVEIPASEYRETLTANSSKGRWIASNTRGLV